MENITLSAKERRGREKAKSLRKQGYLPAVLYGPGAENAAISLEVDAKQANEAYSKAGESSLLTLAVGDKNFQIFFHNIQRDSLSNNIIHIDFYAPSLTKKMEVKIPLVFEGESLAVKNLGGTLIKSIFEIGVKSLAKSLPHEIKVSIASLETFEDRIFVKDLKIPNQMSVARDMGEVVAHVAPLRKQVKAEAKAGLSVDATEKIAEDDKEQNENTKK